MTKIKKDIWLSVVIPFQEIIEIHSKEVKSVYNETTDAETRVLDRIDELIDAGEIQWYPVKALLSACNNWAQMNIVRLGLFQQILLEGIEKGCLSPENEDAWLFMELALTNNNPEEFMTDINRFGDILFTAMLEGESEVHNTAANIYYTIWEPENIIEED